MPKGVHYFIFFFATNRFGTPSSNNYVHNLIRVSKPFVVNIHGPQILNSLIENVFIASVTNCNTGLKDDQDYTVSEGLSLTYNFKNFLK